MSVPMAVLDRTTGEPVAEPLPHGALLRAAYAPGPWLAGAAGPLISALVGWAARQGWSRRQIPAFAEQQGVDPDTVGQPLAAFPSLDAFFARSAPAGARPVDPAPDALVSPCDGAVQVWSAVASGDRLPVKGATPTLATLLGDSELATALDGAAVALVRLAPGDLHRIVQPVDGARGLARRLEGPLHSVHPAALDRGAPALRNRRVVLPVADGVVVAVGALNVGSVEVLSEPGGGRRGDELAAFHLGGSAVVLVLPEVTWDPDLLAATAAGHEVRIQQGERIGSRAVGARILPFPSALPVSPGPTLPDPATVVPLPRGRSAAPAPAPTLPDARPAPRAPDRPPAGLFAALDLPNLATLLSLTVALAAGWAALEGDIRLAFLALGASAFLDGVDGGLARLVGGTEQARRLGRHLDTLVDACAFGVVPALILYQAGLRSPLELVVLAALPVAVVLRLAWYAVHGGRAFRGLPSTAVGVLLPAVGLLWLVDPPALRIGASSLVAALVVGMLAPVPVPRPGPRGHVLMLFIAALTATAWISLGG